MRQSRAGALTAGVLSLWAVTLSVSAGAAPAGKKLTLNGKAASNNVQTINGQAFVSLADMAKALGMVVVKKTDGSYEIKKAGGTFQTGDLDGKVGDVLFDGKWRFQVLSVQTPESHTMKTSAELYDYTGLTTFDRPNRLVRPKAGNKLVVIHCRLTNAVKDKRTLWTALSDKAINTALADMEGSSYAPVGYDFEGGPIQSPWLLPGASLNFPVLFSVPQNTQLKDLIFSLKNNQTSDKVIDVRVSLATPSTAAANSGSIEP